MKPYTAVSEHSSFTFDNIPFGVIKPSPDAAARCATAIGDYAVDLAAHAQSGALDEELGGHASREVFAQPSLNTFAALPQVIRSRVRQKIQQDLVDSLVDEQCFFPLSQVINLMPMDTREFSDFYCSLEHCQNCSPMSANVVPDNWFYAPSVYNARASSLVVSPQPIQRPRGVYFGVGVGAKVNYGPSRMLDFELEMGYFVSKKIPRGEIMRIGDAKEHIFGFVILNDWSARDLQLFEMKPLGPFHSKGFGTSISPWIVTLDALEPFICAPKTTQNPRPFPHLSWKDEKTAALDIKLRTKMIRKGKEYTLAESNLRYLYWTPYQQLAHHASAMCGMNTGDLCGTGTISGDGVDGNGKKTELGCLYEATVAGSQFITLSDGQQMQYLDDGDEIIMEASCNDQGKHIRLGFGECRGLVLPA